MVTTTFFITIPISFWSYSNHVEETVMTLFATMSVYYLSNALFNKEKIIVNIILAGICIFLSSLTKGLQGLFPICGVFFYWMLNKRFSFKKNILYSGLLIGTPVIIYAVLLVSNHHIYEVCKLYFENRLGKAFYTTENNTTDNRFEILFRLFTELIPMFLLIFIIYLSSWKYKVKQKINFVKLTWVLLIGVSGSLPLIVTQEQRGFYLLTSLPFFAIAGGMVCANRIDFLTEKINISGNLFYYGKLISVLILLFFLRIYPVKYW